MPGNNRKLDNLKLQGVNNTPPPSAPTVALSSESQNIVSQETKNKLIDAGAQVRVSENKLLGDQALAGAQYAIADAQVESAKITTDPLVLDANETKAYELIKKTGILKDLAAFQAKLASGDKEAKSDALQLEKALAADGKSLTVDGVITSKTIDAARALIGENADVILKYEKTLELIGAPTSTPATPQANSTEKS
ncbi:MAG: hypothetical protein JWO06_1656 [Bacteroidota bacterium]|nr:hypothetical protein [Bacteroidota bacterium]